MSIPYTYFICWSKHNLWYYGTRYAKDCSPNDLFTSYFTSSRPVKETILMLGLPDVIQVRRIFHTAQAARNWEAKVLQRMNVVNRTDCLNQHDRLSPPINRMFGVNNPQSRIELIEQKRQRVKSRAAQKISAGINPVSGLPLQECITWSCIDCNKTKLYKPFELKYRQKNKVRCKSCAATKRNLDRSKSRIGQQHKQLHPLCQYPCTSAPSIR
jgi:aspartate carbamoyltransferase regulatory subunit